MPEAGAPVVHTEGLVTFSDERPPHEVAREEMKPIDLSLKASMIDQREHSLREILERPYLHEVLSWSTATAANADLAAYQIPYDVLTNYANLSDKLRGFLGIRATVVMTVQVNAQPFDQGALMLNYFPIPLNKPAMYSQTSHLVSRSQLPSVVYDINSCSECSIEIPYVHMNGYYNNVTRTLADDWARAYITVLSPIVLPNGPAAISVNVWFKLKDVEFVYPTMSQSLKTKKGRGGGSVGETELSAAASGPISAVLGTVGKVATILSDVPLLSGIARPVAWFSNIGANVASAFGWSNPSASEHCKRIVSSAFFGSNNCNSVDNSLKLGLFTDNQVQVLPGYAGTDIDELALDYVLGRESYWKSVSWATTDAVDALLSSAEVTPRTFCVEEVANDGTNDYEVFANTPLSYFSRFFTQWKGDVSFKFHIVKTKFHSGRLCFWFAPGVNAATPTKAQRQYLFQQVVDIRESNEFTITVPFTFLNPYAEFENPYSGSIGTFGITVVNPLLAANTVSSSVKILWFVNGAQGFELHKPLSLESLGGANFPVQLLPSSFVMEEEEEGEMFDDLSDSTFNVLEEKMKLMKGLQSLKNHKSKDRFRAQALGEDISCGGTAQSHLSAESIDGSGPKSLAISPSRFCVGENMRSLRQLIKRSTLVFSATLTSTPGFRLGGVLIDYIKLATARNAISAQAYYLDWFSIVGVCYGMRRGGYRLKWMNSLMDTSQLRFNADMSSNIAIYTASPGLNGFNGANLVYQPRSLQGGVEIEFPQYGPRHSFVNVNEYAMNQLADSTCIPYWDKNRITVNTLTAASIGQMDLLRQASEDTDFGFFIGCPYTYTRSIL